MAPFKPDGKLNFTQMRRDVLGLQANGKVATRCANCVADKRKKCPDESVETDCLVWHYYTDDEIESEESDEAPVYSSPHPK